MTAASAGPGMTDVMFAHVSRPVWRNQIVIAPDAGNSIRRIALGRDARHDQASRDYVFDLRTRTLPFRNFHGSAGISHPCERNRILRTDKKDRLHTDSR